MGDIVVTGAVDVAVRRSLVWNELVDLGVIRIGHFRHRLNLHSRYKFSARMLPPAFVLSLLTDLVSFFDQRILDEVTAIVGPSNGELEIAPDLALFMGEKTSRNDLAYIPMLKKEVAITKDLMKAFWQISDSDQQRLHGAVVMIATDVRFSGATNLEAIYLVESLGGRVISTASLIDTKLNPPSYPPHYSLGSLEVKDVWPIPLCPLCSTQVPLTWK